MLSKLFDTLSKAERCVVAYSGGVDSTLIAFAARKVLGESAQVISFVTPLIDPTEVLAARTLSDVLGLDARFLNLDPRISEKVFNNELTRCYVCKHLLFSSLIETAGEGVVVFDGTNFDDLFEDRPGLVALQELGVRSPLAECKIDKLTVRLLARELGLPNAEKPAAPCLATRFEQDTKLEDSALAKVANAEERIRALGFTDFRVRVSDLHARVEIADSSDTNIQRLISKALKNQYKTIEFANRG